MTDFIFCIACLWFIGACGWMLNDLHRRSLGASAILFAFTAFTLTAARSHDHLTDLSTVLPRQAVASAGQPGHYLAAPDGSRYHAEGCPFARQVPYVSATAASNSGRRTPCQYCLKGLRDEPHYHGTNETADQRRDHR